MKEITGELGEDYDLIRCTKMYVQTIGQRKLKSNMQEVARIFFKLMDELRQNR